MDISVTNAKAHLTDLVRRAEAGEDVVLTRHGRPSARIVAVHPDEANADRKRSGELPPRPKPAGVDA